MKITRHLLMTVGIMALAACAGLDEMDEVKAVNEINPVGNAFSQKLTMEYRDFVNQELQDYKDHADALHFSRKGLSSARGDMPMPEAVSDWDVLPGHAEELIVARSRLVDLYGRGAREMQPELSAYAQARFDCWIEEQEENFQLEKISACKTQFMDAVAQLESAIPLPPPPAPEPMPMEMAEPFDVDPQEPMKIENAKYIVFFDFDASELNDGANSIIDAAAEEAMNRQLRAINLVGHTDTSGSRSYNQKLSMARADAVKNALAARGVDTSMVNINFRGEDELLISTADGVREPANRRTEITFE